jgi:aspartyl-tRNA(Asn)/glutamyl-tRNA(Gln) amidotransferase subunit C
MKIDKATLEKTAHLARLEFGEQEAEQMMQDMTAVLSWVEKLNEVNTEGIEPLTTMSQEVNAFREDVVKNQLTHDEALLNAPAKADNYFKVPKVMA